MNMAIWTCPAGFKIKSKADVKRFLKECLCDKEASYYITEVDDGWDYAIDFDKDGKPMLTTRPKSARGNIFNPYIEVVNGKHSKEEVCEEFCWQNRKVINRQFFNGR